LVHCFPRKKRLKTNTSELHQLKKLLLDDELAQLKELESKLLALEFEVHDAASISKKILPLFDDMLLEKLQAKEGRTIELLSTHLAQIILNSSHRDLPALSNALQNVISPAISKEIEDNKDKMVDTLYPIMGGMISKYVTHAIKEMMEKINEKVENGLSFERVKRKIKSRLTGVSESELLLEESNDALIDSLFIIQKESGLLIAEAHLQNQEIDDPHLVASMASAIKDFINDWVKQQEQEVSEVQIVSYANATLYIESAGSVYLIAFLNAEPDFEQRKEINTFFGALVKNHSTFFQNFSGDSSDIEIMNISEKASSYLKEQFVISEPSASKTSKLPKTIILILLIFFSAGYVFSSLAYYDNKYMLELKVYRETGYHIDIQLQNDQALLKGTVQRLKDVVTIEDIVKKETGKTIQNELSIPISRLAKILLDNNRHIKQDTLKLKKTLDILQKKIGSQ